MYCNEERECVKISEMKNNKYCSVYGIVADWLECKKSRGSDFVMTLDLADESTVDKLSVKIFSKREIFEQGFCIGDIVRVGCLKLCGEKKAITDRRSDVEIVYSKCNSQSQASNVRIRELVSFVEKNKGRFSKERRISEFPENGQYFDFHGELIDKQTEMSNLVLLKFVDYTFNTQVDTPAVKRRYPEKMVLTVKAWGSFSRIAENCKVGNFYRIRNMRADGVLMASLSESRWGGIAEIPRYTSLKDYLEMQKRQYEMGSTSLQIPIETPDRILKYEPMELRHICASGVYRVRIQIKQHAPFEGKKLTRCRMCDVVEKEAHNFRCGCSSPDVEDVNLLRLLVEDVGGEAIVLCKNKITNCILNCKNKEYLYGRPFDGMVLSVQCGVHRMKHILLDVGFYNDQFWN